MNLTPTQGDCSSGVATSASMAPFPDSVVQGRTILVRVDHNIPTADDGTILDTSRVTASLSSLVHLCSIASRVIILTHRGYPTTKTKNTLSTRVTFNLAAPYLPQPAFCPDPTPTGISAFLSSFPDTKSIYVENVRFLDGETDNDICLARGWAALGDLYVADAFSVIHRRHASVESLARVMPSVAGPSLTAQLSAIDRHKIGTRPIGVMIGGAKSSSKLAIVNTLRNKGIVTCLGGLCGIRAISQHEFEESDGLILPKDMVFRKNDGSTIASTDLSKYSNVCDTGPISINRALEALSHCDPVFWNGPLGEYEIGNDGMRGTEEFSRGLIQLKNTKGIRLVAGGGDTLAVVAKLRRENDFDTLTTAGGALVSYVAHGRELPGLAALRASATSDLLL